MTKLHVFDPPLCCPTGICGPSVDQALVHFAADLDWLKTKGIEVERANLAQQPGAFAENDIVREALTQKGNDCLPLLLVNNIIATEGFYPDRKSLAEMLEVKLNPEDLKSDTPRPIPIV